MSDQTNQNNRNNRNNTGAKNANSNIESDELEKLAQSLIADMTLESESDTTAQADIAQSNADEKKKKKKKNICTMKGCRRKIKDIVKIPCKCGGLYCSTHKFFTEHDCKYDYQGNYRKQLEGNLEKVEAGKIDHIKKDNETEEEAKRRKKKIRQVNPNSFLGDMAF